MGLPQKQLSNPTFQADFRSPRNASKPDLTAFERGGIEIADNSERLDFQDWVATCDGTDITITPQTTGVPSVVYSGTNITEIDLAFDQSMREQIAMVEDGDAKFYWYDTNIQDYAILDLPGCINPRCTLDDHQRRDTSQNDVILCYLRSNNLYYREQRERYVNEYLLVGGIVSLVRMGMGVNRRMQWQITT